MKRFGFLLVTVFSVAAFSSPEFNRLQRVLAEIVENSSSEKLSPATSLSGSPTELNQRITRELDQVFSAFTASDEANRIKNTLDVIRKLSPEAARDGASRVYEGAKPGLSVARQVVFVNIPDGTRMGAASGIVDIISSFERSPKPDDYYYEYSDEIHLETSDLFEQEGSEVESWLQKPRPAILDDEKVILKKCRHIIIMGWYCMTSVTRTLPADTGKESSQAVVSVLKDMTTAADHPIFAQDSRKKNTADGSTSIYLVKQVGKTALIYNVAFQYVRSGNPNDFVKRQLSSGLQEEYELLLKRLEFEFKVHRLPWEIRNDLFQ